MKYLILEITGKSDADIIDGIDNARLHVRQGYIIGGDSSDSGKYNFTVHTGTQKELKKIAVRPDAEHKALLALLAVSKRLIEWIDTGCDPSIKSVALMRAAIKKVENL